MLLATVVAVVDAGILLAAAVDVKLVAVIPFWREVVPTCREFDFVEVRLIDLAAGSVAA